MLAEDSACQRWGPWYCRGGGRAEKLSHSRNIFHSGTPAKNTANNRIENRIGASASGRFLDSNPHGSNRLSSQKRKLAKYPAKYILTVRGIFAPVSAYGTQAKTLSAEYGRSRNTWSGERQEIRAVKCFPPLAIVATVGITGIAIGATIRPLWLEYLFTLYGIPDSFNVLFELAFKVGNHLNTQ